MYQQHIIVGNLGNDPVLRYTPSGTPVCNFNVAVNKTWTSGNGERMQKVTWFRITAWRTLADVAAQYLSKGRQVLIEGEVEEASAWVDKNGEMRATNEVTANVIKFLGKAGDYTAMADVDQEQVVDGGEDEMNLPSQAPTAPAPQPAQAPKRKGVVRPAARSAVRALTGTPQSASRPRSAPATQGEHTVARSKAQRQAQAKQPVPAGDSLSEEEIPW